MLTALKFVQGAVARKDFQPALTHFRIKDGRVIGYDGLIALSSPIDLDIEASPKAVPFIKAIERCEDTTAMHMTTGQKLSLRSGAFRAYVECAEETEILDGIEPEGEDVAVPANLMTAIRAMAPFISEDASRPWSMGLLLREDSVWATNNIILAQYYVGEQMPEVNLPSAAVAELLRIKEVPVKIQLAKNTATFHYADGRWLRTQLLSSDWPQVAGLLDRGFEETVLAPVPEGLYEAVEKLVPFVGEEGRIIFRDGKIQTSYHDEEGASWEVVGIPDRGAYHYKQLRLLQGAVQKIDFSKHPQPCPFVGENMRGIFLGMVDA